jgi:GT2 family glycosyltransferase
LRRSTARQLQDWSHATQINSSNVSKGAVNLPSASVIVVTLNRPEDVRRCLASFHDTLPDHCEAIVVDASADDKTAAVVCEFPRARYLHSSVRNRCVQRNLGIQASNREVVAFLDDDCIAQPGWLTELLRGYTDPFILSVVGAIQEEGLEQFPTDQAPVLTAHGLTQPITNWPCPTTREVLNGQGGNMSFRRVAILEIGGFDSHYLVSASGEEPDVFVRLRRAGGRIWYTPDSLTLHRPAKTQGFTRSSFDRRFMFWLGYNHGYGNTKLFFGRREFFWYFGWDALRFLGRQLVRLLRSTGSIILVTGAHLLGRAYGFCKGLRWHLNH